MKVGIHAGMSESEYDLVPAVRSTSLRKLASSTPMHCHYAEQHGTKETESLSFGRAFHAAILEPERFEREWVEQPSFGDQRNTQNKARKLAWVTAHSGAQFLTPDEMQTLKRMREEVLEHPICHYLLTAAGANEVSIFWKDPSGLDCKVRLDRLTQWDARSCIVDFKSCQSAHPGHFGADMLKWGYHVQAAFYLRGLHHALLASGEDEPDEEPHRTFAFVCVEKQPPHAVATYELKPEELEIGRRDLEAALQTYARCTQTGRWPGYPDALMPVRFPAWAYRQMEDAL